MHRIFRFLPFFAFSLLVTFSAAPADAAKYPTREVRMIVPWNAGGNNDLMARVAQPLLEKQGIKIVVENIPGGSSAIGLGAVATAKPDGYTLGWASSSILAVIAEGKVPLGINQFTYLVKGSEDPVLLLVGKNFPYKTIKDFMANIKANPDKVTIGAPGARTVNDLLAIMASRSVGSSHRSVPYPGGSRVVAELLGGQIDAAALKPAESMQVIQSGDVIPLGFLTKDRSPELAHLPTFIEEGFNTYLYGPLIQMSFVVAPANLPEDIKAILTKAFTEVFNSKEYNEFAVKNGFMVMPISGAELETQVKDVEQALRVVLKEIPAQ